MLSPNFFLIGAPKCGTTAVAKALSRHPQIFMSEPKEPSYFLFTEGNPYGFDTTTRVSDLQDYLALFAGAGGKRVIGEASPLYIHAPYVAEEIHRFNPDAKIMAILRNPVERACSMYLSWYQRDRRVQLSPEDFRRKFLSGAIAHVPITSASRGMELLKSFGFYHELLKPYYAAFPESHILVTTYDDLKADSAAFTRRILAFLDVDQNSLPSISPENVTVEPKNRELYYWLNSAVTSKPRQLLKRVLGPLKWVKGLRNLVNSVNLQTILVAQFLTDDIYRDMIETYREDIVNLSVMVGRDFTPWLERAALFTFPFGS
jgi:hypothetical protein